ncbi:MAG TPA: DUF4129 domain-containing protein [Natrialbaceae archaeon]|nr:DUF4129 domain-containing protein [Natrialbaceae archaeon]
MPRNALPTIAAVLLVILAVGVAAATITDPLDTSGPTPDPGERGPDGGKFWDFELDPGEGMDRGGAPTEKVSLFWGTCVPFLLTPWFYALIGLTLIGVFLSVRWKLSTQFGIVAVIATAPWILIGHSWFTNCSERELPGGQFGMEYIASENDSVATVIESAGQSSPLPPGLLGGLLILAVVVLPLTAFFGLRSHRSEDDPNPNPGMETDEPLTGVGQVAGRAADRIEGSVGDVDNEVFRAWKRMTDFVDVPEPKSSTPAEFARAARDAGMDEDDVSLLTDLFRSVRYGGEEATEDREQQAIEALRAIAAAYGEGGDEE